MHFLANTSGESGRGNTTRLTDGDSSILEKATRHSFRQQSPVPVEQLWDLRRLSRSRLSRDNHDLVLSNILEDLVFIFIHRKRVHLFLGGIVAATPAPTPT